MNKIITNKINKKNEFKSKHSNISPQRDARSGFSLNNCKILSNPRENSQGYYLSIANVVNYSISTRMECLVVFVLIQ